MIMHLEAIDDNGKGHFPSGIHTFFILLEFY